MFEMFKVEEDMGIDPSGYSSSINAPVEMVRASFKTRNYYIDDANEGQRYLEALKSGNEVVPVHEISRVIFTMIADSYMGSVMDIFRSQVVDMVSVMARSIVRLKDEREFLAGAVRKMEKKIARLEKLEKRKEGRFVGGEKTRAGQVEPGEGDVLLQDCRGVEPNPW